MIDVTHQIAGVDRRVGRRQIKAGEFRVVTLSQTYPATIDEAWDACTNPERIPRWFLPVSGDLHLGGRYQLEGNAGGVIEVCEPPTHFAATWEFGETTSWIEVTLTDEGDGMTRVQLEHLVPADAHWEEFGPGAVGVGWDTGLIGLTTHLASGVARDPAAAMAWMMSPEGQRFVRESADRWRESDVAGGEGPDTAAARAERTAAAFGAPAG